MTEKLNNYFVSTFLEIVQNNRFRVNDELKEGAISEKKFGN